MATSLASQILSSRLPENGLEALKEIKPGISEVLLIVNPNNPGTVGLSRFVEKLGPAHLVELIPTPVQTASDIERRLQTFSTRQIVE